MDHDGGLKCTGPRNRKWAFIIPAEIVPDHGFYAYGYEEDGFEVVDLLNDLEDKKYDERFVDIIEPIAEAALSNASDDELEKVVNKLTNVQIVDDMGFVPVEKVFSVTMHRSY